MGHGIGHRETQIDRARRELEDGGLVEEAAGGEAVEAEQVGIDQVAVRRA